MVGTGIVLRIWEMGWTEVGTGEVTGTPDTTGVPFRLKEGIQVGGLGTHKFFSEPMGEVRGSPSPGPLKTV